MNTIKIILEYLGHASTVTVLVTLAVGVVAWLRGILPALLRLGNGLAKRKIAIFAKGDNLTSLKDLLLDSKLFNKNNIINITTKNDLGKAEKSTLFLVFWPDWKSDIENILIKKGDETVLIVYAPQESGFIPKNQMSELTEERNVMVTNFRGRLLNDIVVSMITTSYRKG